ncbi:co-regulatory protein PtrA N-terminal domain-containing protein [Pseudomonas sp. H3(2019)]|uniref:co-regulatory protein PtrA N-terminal domain-containing protein n=1 Tax=Pseudomonas sp. H3(2019) TaxID=2598724 RepID=UPI001190CF45|nr:co-regulatory protein PtrA N-terminal domain-containing protein [Pseudomonas sp. H3(2019)]TVT81682.1 hypothetical protein FPT12_18300 [Pseudomonas sp. H3(2019)]
MKLTQVCAFLGALILSSIAMAEGGGDRTFDRMMAANEQAVQAFAANQAKNDSVVLNDAKDDKTKEM